MRSQLLRKACSLLTNISMAKLLLCLSSLVYAQPPAPVVYVSEAVNLDVSPTNWVAATVIGRYDSKLAGEVEGRLVQVLEVGDSVHKGQLVAQIEDTTFKLRVAEAEAELIPIQAKLDFYQRESKRLEKLAKENNAAKNRLDEVASDYDEHLGQIKATRLRLAQAKDTLSRTSIVAPFNGVVSERYKSKGERVDVGDEVIRLVDTDSLEIQARLPLAMTSYVTTGSKLLVSGLNRSAEASVRTLVPVGDDVSRLYELRLVVEQMPWMAGQALRVAVPVSEKRSVVAVPRDALVIREQQTRIIRINSKNIAEQIQVSLGIAEGNMIEVVGPVLPGDKIVVRGNERIRPGQTVQIRDELPNT